MAILPSGDLIEASLIDRSPDDQGSGNIMLLLQFEPLDDAGTVMRRAAPLFCLTAAEAAVAAEVLNGKTVEEISASRGLSPNTIRTHLKSVFAKTGVTRQADLVRTFARFVTRPTK